MMPAMQRLKVLWQGHLPLEVAFWNYAIFYGLVFNILGTGAALVLFVLDVPVAFPVIMHLLPVPYSVLALVGVWRSADHYAGPPKFAILARIVVLAWFCVWMVF